MSDFERLSEGQVDLWFCVPKKIADADLEGYCEQVLNSGEREHHTGLKTDHRLEYLVSRALLRTTLSHYLPGSPEDWTFRRNHYGKPELESDLAGAGPLRFNLSQTRGLTLCAVTSGHDIGVDVEFRADSQGMAGVADHYFSERELADLRQLPEAEQEQAFFHYWTLKEAYIKARGEGLSIPLDSFSFLLGEGGSLPGFLPPPGDEAENQWDFRLYQPGADYTAAVALQAPIQRIRLFESWCTAYRELDDIDQLFAE